MAIRISDASPIQFWAVGCDTWNNQSPAGVHHYCFCHPWQCNDTIKIPFESTDEDEVEEFISKFNSDLSGWFNTSNGVTPATGGSTADWAWSSDLGGSAKVTTVNTFGTKSLRLSSISSDIPQQSFILRIKFSISTVRNSSNLRMSFIIRDASNNQLFNQSFGTTSTGSEQTQDFLITTSSIWENADHFLITTSSTAYVAGDDLHVSEISYLFDQPASYKLKAFNEDGDKLFSIQIGRSGTHYTASFIPIDYGICDGKIELKIFSGNAPQIDIDPLSEWVNVNTGAGPSWTTGSNPSISLPTSGTISDELSGVADAEGIGTFTFAYDLDLSSGVGVSGIDIFIILYKDGIQVGIGSDGLTSSDGNKTGQIEISASDIPNDVRVRMELGVGHVNVDINSITPVIDVPDVELLDSDCLDIKTTHSESLLMEYSNHSNYAGIKYGNITPDPSFSLRIPAIFFETRFPQEGEDIELSGSQIIALNSELKEQRLLSTDRMPTYMHRKVALVLSHQFLYIDGTYWIKGSETYEKKEKSNKRDSLDMYSCWLTRQDFIARNIL